MDANGPTSTRPPRKRLAGHLALARISNSPTVVSNVLAGAALAGGLQAGPTLLLLGVAMVSLYTAGMYLNDVFDYASDRERRPERPLVAGAVSLREATVVGFGLLALGSVLLVPMGPTATASGFVLVVLIVAYDLWHKTNPLSPVVMAACRVMVYVTAYLALAPDGLASATSSPVPLVVACLLLGSYLVGLTYVSKVEDRLSTAHPEFPMPRSLGALPGHEICHAEPQRSISRETLRCAQGDNVSEQPVEGGPVPFGFAGGNLSLDLLRFPARYWPAALVLLPAAYFATHALSWLVAPVLALFVGWALYSLWLVYRPTNKNIGGAIGRLIAGISLLDGLVLATAGSGIGVLAALLAFRGTHVLQRYVKGT